MEARPSEKLVTDYAQLDPGFLVGGGANPPGGGERQHTPLQNVPKNCMKLRNFWAIGGRGARWGRPPLGSATGMVPADSIVWEMAGPETDFFSMMPEIEN